MLTSGCVADAPQPRAQRARLKIRFMADGMFRNVDAADARAAVFSAATFAAKSAPAMVPRLAALQRMSAADAYRCLSPLF